MFALRPKSPKALATFNFPLILPWLTYIFKGKADPMMWNIPETRTNWVIYEFICVKLNFKLIRILVWGDCSVIPKLFVFRAQFGMKIVYGVELKLKVMGTRSVSRKSERQGIVTQGLLIWSLIIWIRAANWLTPLSNDMPYAFAVFSFNFPMQFSDILEY